MQLSSSYQITQPGKLGQIALLIGIAGLVLSGVGYAIDHETFFFSWLVAFMFWLSIGLGGLFFTMLHHMVDAKWSIVVRRITESLMSVLPWMAILFIPILLGMSTLFPWASSEFMAQNHLVASKAGYLNTPFFIVRAVLYFGIWTALSYSLYRLSRRQDTQHTPAITKTVRRISAPGIFLFALTSTFAGFDWLMSLDPAWYSTIFGVYLFAGGFLAIVCFVMLFVLYLRKNGILVKEITSHHYHDLGKWMFAFVVFWTYMAFSQYFLIWYADIPEETVWYLHRWEGSWKVVSLLLMFGHFAFPFVFLVSRWAKANLTWLMMGAIWLLIMRYVDLYWIILPNHDHHGAHISWINFAPMLAIGGLFVWMFWRKFTSAPILPIGDPGLQASKQFVNVG